MVSNIGQYNMPSYFNATIRNMSYRLRKFKDDIPTHLNKLLVENEKVITNIVKWNQLYDKGINGDNVEIISYAPYKQSTIQNKIRKRQPTNRVTLRDTGAFYRKFRLHADNEGFYIYSEDSKSDALVEKYGDKIFRLTNSNFTIVIREHIRPKFIEILKNNLKK